MNRLTQKINESTAKTREAIASGSDKAKAGLSKAKETSGELLSSGKERAAAGVQKGRELAVKASDKSLEQIDSTPLAVIAGGLIIGGLIAAFLPETQREKNILGKTGAKLNGKVKSAASAAKTAGSSKLEELGVSKDSLQGHIGGLVDKAINVAKEVSSTAAKAAKEKTKN